MGRGVSRVCEWSRHRQMAAGVGRPGACQHHLHPGLARVRLPHHGVQLASRQDTRRQTNTTRYDRFKMNRSIASEKFTYQ